MSMPTLFFDLDGTLTDSKPGITRCIAHAMAALGQAPPPAGELGWCVGPPLKASFARLLGSTDQALLDRALALYRERFASVGLFENSLYPRVPETLALLAGAGYRQCVVTAKPQVYARRIADHFGLVGPIDTVYGSEPRRHPRRDKGDLIAYVLELQRPGPGRGGHGRRPRARRAGRSPLRGRGDRRPLGLRRRR